MNSENKTVYAAPEAQIVNLIAEPVLNNNSPKSSLQQMGGNSIVSDDF